MMPDTDQNRNEKKGRQCRAFSRKTWNRCGRFGEWSFFCDEHKMFPLYLAFVLVFTVGSGLVTYYTFLFLTSKPNIESPSKGIVQQQNDHDGEVETEYSKIDIPTRFEKNGFRFRYLQLNETRQIKSLIEGSLAKDFPAMFNTEPFLLKNEIHRNLEKLIPEIDLYPRLLVSQKFDIARIKSKFESDPNYLVRNPVFRPHAEHTCSARADYALGFIGASNSKDLAGKYKNFPVLFNKLIGENPEVPDVGLERLVLLECECEWEMEFYLRPVKVIVLDIENISTSLQNIQTVSGEFRRSPAYSLHSASAKAQDTFEESTLQFPVEILKPGERLLIPMAVLLASVSDQGISPNPESIPNEIPASRFVLDESGNEIAVPPKTRPQNIHNEYYVGSTFLPKTINSTESIRPFDIKSVVYQGPFGIGSCPFVFTYVPKHDRWFQIGTAITKMKGKENEGVSRLRIPIDTNGTIKIKELEDEISYLDHAYLAIEFENGENESLLSTTPKLRHRDGKYLTLSKGQMVELNFSIPKRKIKAIELVTAGYFVLTP